MTRVRLPIDVRSVGVARTMLDETLRLSDGRSRRARRADIVADAALMLSELVTNAIRYARAVLLVEIRVDGDTLYVAVVDDARGLPVLSDRALRASGGRDLKIVDALADRWGFTPDVGRKTVWFEMAMP